MGSMLGGSQGSGGGTLVGGPTPAAAMLSGNYQNVASMAAAKAATDQTNLGIDMVRQQYNNAFSNLKPYTKTGIEALDQLNQYMGLGAYDPGTKPGAANMDQDVTNYILQNSTPLRYDDRALAGIPGYQTSSGLYQYSGPGAYHDTSSFSGGDLDLINKADPNGTSWFNNMDGIKGDQKLRSAVQDYLIQNNLSPAYTDAQNQLDMYNYAKDMQTKYGTALTPDQVSDKLAQTPGYQFQLNQGLDTIQRAASAKGQLGSGRLLQSLVDYGSGLAQQTYGDTLSRLASLAGSGQQAATQQSGQATQLGNQLLGAQMNLGDTIANSYLASGNALAQANLAANQQYQVIGGNQNSGGSGLGSLLGGAASLLGSYSNGGAGLMGLIGGK